MDNPFEDHPGSRGEGCPLRLTVTARDSRVMNGYACALTGGHCLPGDHCDARRREGRRRQRIEELEYQLCEYDMERNERGDLPAEYVEVFEALLQERDEVLAAMKASATE